MMASTENFKSLAMSVLMSPEMANFSGHVHGGAILRLLDQVAYSCAARYSGSYVVTVSVDQVMFRQPVHVGELVTFLSSINYTGKSSMEVGIRVEAEQIRERTRRHVITCYFTMVAVDKMESRDRFLPFRSPTTRDAVAGLPRSFAARFARKSKNRALKSAFTPRNSWPNARPSIIRKIDGSGFPDSRLVTPDVKTSFYPPSRNSG